MSKSKCRRNVERYVHFDIRHLNFVIHSTFGFRHSSFLHRSYHFADRFRAQFGQGVG